MIERNFSSAHQLRGYKGKCENLHGHNYKIEIYARGRELNNIGLLVDFVELKEAADDLVAYLDHKNLNEEIETFQRLVPTSENLGLLIHRRLKQSWHGVFPGEWPQLEKVRIAETARNIFEVSENHDS